MPWIRCPSVYPHWSVLTRNLISPQWSLWLWRLCGSICCVSSCGCGPSMQSWNTNIGKNGLTLSVACKYSQFFRLALFLLHGRVALVSSSLLLVGGGDTCSHGNLLSEVLHVHRMTSCPTGPEVIKAQFVFICRANTGIIIDELFIRSNCAL